MKCNIVRDLLPLYAEGLCSAETTGELEEHFAECGECSALKNGLPLPENGGYNDKEIKPFKKLHRRLKLNIFVIIALGLVAAAVLFFLGGLVYGELNPRSGWLSFSTIARNIEVRRIAGLLEKGDIDGFAEHIYTSSAGSETTSLLLEDFKSAYRSEYGEKNCRVASINTTTVVYWNDSHELVSRVTFDFDGEPLFMQFIKNDDGYGVTVGISGNGSQTERALELLSSFDNIIRSIRLMGADSGTFVPFFAGNGIEEISKYYLDFVSDGSRNVYTFASQPVFDVETRALKSQCCFKFRDGSGNTAILEFTAELKNGRFFSADMSTVSTINQGMSDEKLEQIYDILRASA